jgi:hypothetical protein
MMRHSVDCSITRHKKTSEKDSDSGSELSDMRVNE